MVTRATDRLRRFTTTHTVTCLFLGIGISLILALASVELLATLGKSQEIWLLVSSLLTWVVFLVITAWVATLGVVRSFRDRNRTDILTIIVVSYGGLIVMFSGMYYNMVFFGDYSDAFSKYIHYRYDGMEITSHLRNKPREHNDLRAFRGMDSRLWSGVDWPVGKSKARASEKPGDLKVDIEDMILAAREPRIEDLIRFLPESRFEVFADCMHFSIATITTLGYGDISPRIWYAKLAADVEVLAGVTLFVLALGMALGNWGGGDP